MNAIISDRLSRERSKYADYDDLKAKAAQFDAAQEAGKTELQKANEKAASLQAQLDSLTKANTLRELRSKVSASTGVPAELATRKKPARRRRKPSSNLPAPAIPMSRTAAKSTTKTPAPPASSSPTGLHR